MSGPNTALIDVRGLYHTYLVGTPLETGSLRNVDLQVQAGETVGIIGPTGSGKSTMLQHLNGLLRPQRGQVRILGLDMSDAHVDVRSVRQRVGLVFQMPEEQLFERYAGDDVAFGPRNMGLSVEQVRERVRWAMHLAGLPFAFKDRLTLELSQGQRRQLALAGVLALQPQVLALDEPTAGLDPQARERLLHTLRDWRAQPGHALVLASHNMDDIADLATQVTVLVAGQVALHGTTREVFAQPAVLSAHGLSVPAATQTMLELRQRGYPVSLDVMTVAEAAHDIEALFHA
jgi:energy-coupling factor transport system ATP-binding protein